MEDDLLRYYEQELVFVRRMGEEFAKKYPKVAARLMLEPGKSDDPNTERLIEAFAFLTGRVRKKIEDNFPEITESLLNVVFPHYIRPVPSMSIVDFQTSKTSVPPEGYGIEKGTTLYSRPVNGTPCQFQTCYPVRLLPIEIAAASLKDPKHEVRQAAQALVIQVKAQNNLTIPQIGIQELRFFLNGPSQQMFPLYESLGNDIIEVVCEFRNQQGRTDSVVLDHNCLEPLGFTSDQTMVPYGEQSFSGYGLLLEYFTFPEKFLFFSLKGFDQIKSRNPGDTIDIWLYLKKPVKANILIGPGNFAINATPIVNLYSRVAEPIWIDGTKTDYHVVPDVRRPQGTEVFAIDSVTAVSDLTSAPVELHPFYSIRHHLGEDGGEMAFWRVERRPSGRKGDDGTDLYISFTDWSLSPVDPGVETLSLNVTCTNRDLPSRLPFGSAEGDFEMELSVPVERTMCLVKPTPTRRPAMGAMLQWRLISHLSLNYLSVSANGEDALRELLKLYDFDDSPATRQHISGIVGLKSTYTTKRIGQSFCRGLQVTMEFDEEKYVGSGLYLFASVLERFLAQYVSVNSFSQMIAKTIQRKEPLRIWPPRNGNRVLL